MNRWQQIKRASLAGALTAAMAIGGFALAGDSAAATGPGLCVVADRAEDGVTLVRGPLVRGEDGSLGVMAVRNGGGAATVGAGRIERTEEGFVMVADPTRVVVVASTCEFEW
jgi:hypothetical protein